MGDALRRLFLSIGIALGLASGQPDPALVAQVGVVDGALAVSARVEEAFAPGARELIETGTRVAIRFTADIEVAAGPTGAAEETRSLRYDLRSGRYDVSYGGGKEAQLVDPQAARTLTAELSSLPLCRASLAPPAARVVVRARIGIIDSRGEWHDAPVLWNYREPRAVVAYGMDGR